MRIQRWCLGGLFALLAVVDHGLIANAAGKPGRKLVRANKPSSRSIARMIAGLDSERYIVRRKAARDLMRRGSAAVAPLAKAAQNGSWEVRVRSIVILEVIYTSPDSDDQTVERIEELLETLRATGRAGAAGRAAEVLDRNDDFRERRALIAIKRLGGIIEYLDSARTIRNFPPVPNTAALGQRRLNFVLLGRKWKGGDEGLKYIKRLPGLQNLYIAENKRFQPVSQKARRQLQTAMPNLTIQERGLACLGVSGSPTNANGFGCFVQTVKPGSAAAKGKILPSDYITHFAGKKVPSFQVMVKLIAEHDPGEKVSVVVNRSGKTLTLSIVLGEWTAR